MTYSTFSGHSITEATIATKTIYTDSEVDGFNAGKLVTDENGSRFIIIEVSHVSGRLYRVTLLPQEVQ